MTKTRAKVGFGQIQTAKVDAEGVPTEIVILPFPTWMTDDGEFITDAKAQKACVAMFKRRGISTVVDYEHQTMTGEIAPAAGKIVEMIAGGEKGLLAKVEWTQRAKGFLAGGEYIYHSPVVYYDENRRVIGVHSVALTNSPKSWNQPELRDQVAAKALADVRKFVSAKLEEGDTMKELISTMRYALGMSLTATVNDLKAALQKVIDAIPDSEDMLAMMKAEGVVGDEASGEMTLAGVLGLPIPAPEKTPETVPPIVAAKEVLELLEVPADAGLEVVCAKVLEFKTPTGLVPKADLDAALAEIETAKAASFEHELNDLIAANKAKLPPARETWFRQIAKEKGLEFARETAKHLKDELPAAVAERTAPKEEHAPAAMKRVVGDRELAVSEDSAMLVAKVRAIQAEDPKFSRYEDAYTELQRRSKQ